MSAQIEAVSEPEVTVIIVSYNTRELTLKAIETLFETTVQTPIKVIVLDNASCDGSAEAVRDSFPQVEVIASKDNLGFAAGNNVAAKQANTEWLLLLNPDTECYEGAVDNLVSFARGHPEISIFGGKTYYPDGTLNLGSCWRQSSLWSLFCSAFGLTLLFPNSSVFNADIMGAWKRDDARQVDIVAGCFLLTRRHLWEALQGFDLAFYMYGEETDFCLRAGQLGHKLMITPDANIMHLVGAATGGAVNVRKTKLIYSSKVSLVRKHWSGTKRSLGLFLLKLAIFNRAFVYKAAFFASKKYESRAEHWLSVWRDRKEWANGFEEASSS
ncbi:GT2 family glycosyltransferase [Labrenzia sp. EL_13]|nr:GT2 family glycosyltransferase [Labrenzia sp. EL_13]